MAYGDGVDEFTLPAATAKSMRAVHQRQLDKQAEVDRQKRLEEQQAAEEAEELSRARKSRKLMKAQNAATNRQ